MRRRFLISTKKQNNKIWYTSTDNNIVTPYSSSFGANIISNIYENDEGIITFDKSVKYIGYSAFARCYSLVSIIIPDSVTSIGNYAFDDCDSLTNITIPDSVTKIGDNAFFNCSSLTSVTISESVTWIGKYAFQACFKLASVYCKPTTPPTVSSNTFSSNATGRKIYVPRASVEAYKNAAGWSDYADSIVGYDF